MKDNIIKNFRRQVVEVFTNLRNFLVQKPLNALLIIVLLIIIGVVTYIAILANDFPDWVGFGKYDEVEDGVRAKTLWDWMDLLLVPLTLAIGIYLLNRMQASHEHKIAKDNQRQGTLEDYIDKMSELLLVHNLRESEGETARTIARSRTLSLLRQLDGDRKGTALQFLYESGLIQDCSGIELLGADLSDGLLEGATLNSVRLNGTNCSCANLKNAKLIEAELSGIVLSYAKLQ